MAILNLSVTVPDAEVARLQAAARGHFGQVDDGAGELRDLSNAEITERLRQDVVAMLKQMVRRHERQAALLAAEASVTIISAS
jgi:hypothetical protein